MTTMKPNAYGLLSREQIDALLTVIEVGLREDVDRATLDQESIDSIDARLARAQEAYELLAAERYPRHADGHTLFQLQQAGILPADPTKPEDVGLPTLDPADEAQAIRQVLGALGEPGGYAQDGGFTSRLVHTLFGADSGNQIKLLHTFPALTMAVLRYKGVTALGPSGADGLRLRLAQLDEAQMERLS